MSTSRGRRTQRRAEARRQRTVMAIPDHLRCWDKRPQTKSKTRKPNTATSTNGDQK